MQHFTNYDVLCRAFFSSFTFTTPGILECPFHSGDSGSGRSWEEQVSKLHAGLLPSVSQEAELPEAWSWKELGSVRGCATYYLPHSEYLTLLICKMGP